MFRNAKSSLSELVLFDSEGFTPPLELAMYDTLGWDLLMLLRFVSLAVFRGEIPTLIFKRGNSPKIIFFLDSFAMSSVQEVLSSTSYILIFRTIV